MSKSTNVPPEEHPEWPEILAALDRVQEAISSLDCPYKMAVLSMASGIMLHHLSAHHVPDGITDPKEALSHILRAFLEDMKTAAKSANAAEAEEDQEEMGMGFGERRTLSGVPIKGVH